METGMLASDLRFALDAETFAREALRFSPDPWQADFLGWQGRRILLNCSRQSGKSTVAAIRAAHRALYLPGSLVLLVSPSERQSKELFRKVGDVFDLLDVRREFLEDNKLSAELPNRSRVVSLPGSEKTIRGFSAVDLLLIDEASRVSDDLYSAVRPMLAVSRGTLITLSTPFGKRGWWHDAWTNGGDAWKRVPVPATECPRITPEFLEEERKSMGDLFFLSEYMCEFVDVSGQPFAYDLVMGAISSEITPLFAV